MSFEDKPESFLRVIFHKLASESVPGKTLSCSDYESGKWRVKDFAEYLIEWLPEFALKFSEYANFNGATGKRLLKKAANHVYTTIKKENRGEFGEILLHALIREFFDSKPAVSKVFYKTSANDTVKGFDAVHLVEIDDDYEIWLGEAKFYSDYKSAISDVVAEIHQHLEAGFLRNEFMFVEGKIDNAWELSPKFKELISDRVSLDEIRKRICIPILITYNTDVYSKHTEFNESFEKDIANECNAAFRFLEQKCQGLNIKLHVFLVPLADKQELISFADKKLKGLQE
ncbi:MAG: DUF1837 domain-containing protein [Fibrobacter sp.]|nr:DUF1837 domain-containing protein [Fibrobacter sp.]